MVRYTVQVIYENEYYKEFSSWMGCPEGSIICIWQTENTYDSSKEAEERVKELLSTKGKWGIQNIRILSNGTVIFSKINTKIKLEETLSKYISLEDISPDNKKHIIEAMRSVCKQSLELAAEYLGERSRENVYNDYTSTEWDNYINNEKSVLNVLNHIE